MTHHPFDKLIEWIKNNPQKTILFFCTFLLLTFFALPIVLTQFVGIVKFDDASSKVGDTLGGITGPVIALFGALLTFMAFWIQYKANEQLKKDNKEARKDLMIERFENRFFEMMRQYRENVNELKINKGQTREIIGRDVFTAYYKEILCCFKICLDKLSHYKIPLEIERKYALQLAYVFVFRGVDEVAFCNHAIPKDEEIVKDCKLLLHNLLKYAIIEGGRYEIKYEKIDKSILRQNFSYKPFSGHYIEIGHYFRHLYQSVKYVAKQPEDLLSFETKLEYLTMMRSQISNLEQLLLYFNYVSGYGEKWENEKNSFLVQFKMIHNLPLKESEKTYSALDCFDRQEKELKDKTGSKESIFQEIEMHYPPN